MIQQKTAQQIVDTVKDVCGYDINYIDSRGIILASTNPSRIGSLHEGGLQVIKEGRTLEFAADNLMPGTQRGVNIPIFMNGILTSVIGISGDPDSVRVYARLAEKITLLLLREQQINAAAHTLSEKKNYLLGLLLEAGKDIPDHIKKELSCLQIDLSLPKRILLITIQSFDQTAVSFLESSMSHLLEDMPVCLYGYQYPNMFRAMIHDKDLPVIQKRLLVFLHKNPSFIHAGIGRSVPAHELSSSYSSARIALSSLKQNKSGLALFDCLTLEILLAGIPEGNRTSFISKALSSLDKEDLDLLQTYFSCNQSLAQTCEQLFLHKNTVQYRLNRIFKNSGLNPRNFRDAVILYLALQLLSFPSPPVAD